MTTFRPKENARPEFLLMIMESWTYNRMTVDEKSACLDKIITAEIKGRYLQRWEQLYTVFFAYLDSIGYSGQNWRDAQEAPTETEITEGKEDTTTTETEPQRATERRGKRANYTGAALETFEAIHSGASYIPNQLYKNANGHYYFINAHGYMHIYTARKERSADGTTYYCIVDNLLTEENTLKETLVTYHTTREAARAELDEMKEKAIRTDAETATAATAEGAQPAAVIPIADDTTSATQEASQSATATTGRDCTQKAAQDAQNTHRATKDRRAIQGHTARHKRPYRAAQRAGMHYYHHPTPATATGRTTGKTHFSAGMEAGVRIGLVKRPPPNLAQKF